MTKISRLAFRLLWGLNIFTAENSARTDSVNPWKSGPWKILQTKLPPGDQHPAGHGQRRLAQPRRPGRIGMLASGGGRRHVAEHHVETLRGTVAVRRTHGKDVLLAGLHVFRQFPVDRRQVDAHHAAAGAGQAGRVDHP